MVLPGASDIHPGNTTDVTTTIAAQQQLAALFQRSDLLVTGDRIMQSAANMLTIARAHGRFLGPVDWPPAIRRVLAERTDPELKYAFIGAPTIRTELKRTSLRPIPGLRTVERILQRRGLSQSRRKRKDPNEPTAYCPVPVPHGPNDVHAWDIVTRHVVGGERVCSFHLLDRATHYPLLRQYPDKSAVSAPAFLVAVWQTVGLSRLLQMDNEATFCGGYRFPRVFSQIGRLCLSVGVEVVFIPFYSPKKNADIESFNSEMST